MFLSKSSALIFAISLLMSATATADGGVILGMSGEADTSSGRLISGFIDYGFTEDTRVSAVLARTITGGPVGGLDTLYADMSAEHSFGPIGLAVSGAYWGDKDLLDSKDLRGSIFFRGDSASLSVDYERRAFDFVFASILEQDLIRTVEFTADGLGAAGSVKLGKRNRLFASGMSYDYSRNIRLQTSIDNLRFLSSSRLSLMNSLIDYRLSAGVDFQLEHNRAIDITLSRWQTAIDGGTVDSISFGFVAPSGIATDTELRIFFDKSENYGSTLALSVSFYYFGA